jgi:cytochrome P450
MKHSSVFVNDAVEAGRLVGEMTAKGPIYSAFRFDSNVPDLLACDEAAWEVRRKALGPALSNMRVANEDSITAPLLKALHQACESGESLDFMTLCTYLSMDCVCEAAFGYSLGAVAGSSEEAQKLYKGLCSISDASAATGIYASATARKVPQDELLEARATWRAFLVKMLALIRSDSEQFRAKNGELDVEHNFGHALIQLSVSEEAYGDAQLLSEIHQVFKHAQESLAGTLCWLFVALHRNPKVRAHVEKAIVDRAPGAAYPDYLERVILETLRRFPVLGNMTVRTVNDDEFKVGGFTVPKATPVHIHIWSFHNNNHAWEKPKDFNPDRWLVEKGASNGGAKEGEAGGPPKGPPACPFMAAAARLKGEGLAGADGMVRYNGLGHTQGGLDFFPFSAGSRGCPGKTLALQVQCCSRPLCCLHLGLLTSAPILCRLAGAAQGAPRRRDDVPPRRL